MSGASAATGVWTGTIGIAEDHLALHDTARRWVEANVDPKETKALLDAAAADEALPSFWPAMAELGWLGLHIDERHGGEGFGAQELVVVLEELGRACAPGPFLPTVMASAVMQALGAEEVRDALLPGLAGGSRRGAVVLPAGDATSSTPTFDASTAAGGAIELHGAVRPVLGAGVADVLVVAGRSGDEIIWCVVERDADGLSVTALPSADATRPVGLVEAAGVIVPPSHQLRSSEGTATVASIAATLIGAECTGGIAWCVDTAATYAAERVQFGRPIGQFQAVKHRCANLSLLLEQSRATAWDAARAVDAWTASPGDGELRTQLELAAAACGATAPEAFVAAAKDCIQVLGGIGYTWEHHAHLYIKRAAALRSLLGGPSPWRRAVTRLADAGARRSLRVSLPAEADDVRDEVRAFVADLQQQDKSTWSRTMADEGYLVPYWPKPWGRAAGPLEQLVIDEELAAARIRRPHLQVGAWVLPTLIEHATPEQQERWIRPTLHGEILWCQLFSEPGAGSDLASLATKATRDDERGGWVLNGQKVWTTMAHLATWGICLARTDPDAPKHDGISCFMLDMTTAGIDIRPLRELTGAELFNEVFLDDVFVPDDCVVGEVNGGWEAARTTLANERVSMGSGSSFGPGIETVLGALPDDPVVHDEVGALLATGHAVAVLGLRSTLRALAGATPGPESSVRKLIGVEHEQRVQEVGLALLGQDGATVDGMGAVWVNGFLGNRALSIAGGTSDVQRNIIAERLLGLPKDD